MSEHDMLIWGNPPGGRTSQGELLPPGWVWCCSCGQSSVGFPTEDAAGEGADFHMLSVGAEVQS